MMSITQARYTRYIPKRQYIDLVVLSAGVRYTKVAHPSLSVRRIQFRSPTKPVKELKTEVGTSVAAAISEFVGKDSGVIIFAVQ